ncbi:C-glycoside deglycosidase beta subunit domain-containing protein [Microbacterium sp. F51-2R]|uniref:C-glycoside deglycosidase beta subunit domain-containing protein n=1 Tax=Microbacterium sp. F51-2R TaxID=3445777 RepID=UPI003FA03B6D
MIPDRIIEQGTLTTDGRRAAVEVRLPWYRALPASCIGGATLTIDGVEAPAESLRWEMNGRTFTFAELVPNTEEWWFPTDSAVLSGDIPVAEDGERKVEVGLVLYIPYIVIGADEVLHIEEKDAKTMTARKAVAA